MQLDLAEILLEQKLLSNLAATLSDRGLETKNDKEFKIYQKHLLAGLKGAETNREALKNKIIDEIEKAQNYMSLANLLRDYMVTDNPDGGFLTRDNFFNTWSNSNLKKLLGEFCIKLVKSISLYQTKEINNLKKLLEKSHDSFDPTIDKIIYIALSNSSIYSKNEKDQDRFDKFWQEIPSTLETLPREEKDLQKNKNALLGLRINQLRSIYQLIGKKNIYLPESEQKYFHHQKRFNEIFPVEIKNETCLNDALQDTFTKMSGQEYDSISSEKLELIFLTFMGKYLLDKKYTEEERNWVINKVILFTESQLKYRDIVRMAEREMGAEPTPENRERSLLPHI